MFERHGLAGLIKTPPTSVEQSALAVHRVLTTTGQQVLLQVRFIFLKVCSIIKRVMFVNVCVEGRGGCSGVTKNIGDTETRARLGDASV